VREARPILMHFENTLAASLSCDSRSHDTDREPRRKLCEVLNALDDLDKAPKRFKRISCPVCGKSVTVSKSGWIRSHQGGPNTDKNGWCRANHEQPNAEVSEGGTRDSRIETAAQSRPSLH